MPRLLVSWITLECNEEIPFIEAFSDASYGITRTRNSQTGHVISIGKGPIYTSPTKQKLVTKSSTEAELVTYAKTVSQAKYVQNILNELHIENQGIRIHQDNMSTIKATSPEIKYDKSISLYFSD